MNKDTKVKQIFAIVLTIFLFVIFLCGCTENNRSNDEENLNKFIGNWSGEMETSIFGFRGNRSLMNDTGFQQNGTNLNFTEFRENNTTANITNLEFTSDTLYMTITTINETQIIPFIYTIDGNQLILSFQFNGERLPFDGEWSSDREPPPSDGESPFDGDRPPFDGEWPSDGETPFDGQQPFRKISYFFGFNEDYSILYLDGSSFTKN